MQHPFQIDSNEISNLLPDRFTLIVNHLLSAEAIHLKIPVSQVQTSLRNTATDRGIDALVQAGEDVSEWLPAGLSVWQFKAGKALGQPDIRQELRKSGVREALARGATYCLVLGADLKPTALSRRQLWVEDAIKEVQPGAPFKILDAAHVAIWATRHPSVSLFYFGRPTTKLWPLKGWLQRQPQHRIPFQADDMRVQIGEAIRSAFAAEDGPIHARIQGPPGVGKTRLALEVFRNQVDIVLYSAEPTSDPEFFAWMSEHDHARCILVVDESDGPAAARIVSYANMSDRRLRVLTVGHEAIPDAGAYVFTLDPLDEQTMINVVRSVSRTLGPEQVQWIVQVSRGYVKLATVLAEQVARDPSLTVTGLTSVQDVVALLERLLPDEQTRRVMSALALLTRVGWAEDVSGEGKAIAAFFGIPWEAAQQTVAQMVKKGIIVRRQRYLYVTPEILALWLAAAAWDTRGRDLLDLLDRLPNAESRDAMMKRLASLGGVSEVDKVLDEVLGPDGPFQSIGALGSNRAAELFSTLARGHPRAAVDALTRLIAPMSSEDLQQFVDGRRHVVSTLERLLWRRETFFDAAKIMRRLAEAENETWANNATGIWSSLFLTRLAPTEVPGPERMSLLDESYGSDSCPSRQLALLGVKNALTVHEFGLGMGVGPGTSLPPRRWQPHSEQEDHSYRRSALDLLDAALNDPDEGVRDQAYRILLDASPGLVTIGLIDDVIARFETLGRRDEHRRRELWESIQRILKIDRVSLSEDQRQRLSQQAEGIFGPSLHDRIRRYVGRRSLANWPERNASPAQQQEAMAAALANEAIGEPDALKAELPWLTSGEAAHVWYFGHRLGEIDAGRIWLDAVAAAAQSGADPRLASGYLKGRADAGDTEWREQLLDRWSDDPARSSLVFDVSWRGDPSERAVRRLIKLVDTGRIEPARLGWLVYGAWSKELPADDLASLLERLLSDDSAASCEASLAMLTHWSEEHGGRLDPPLIGTAWTLIERETAFEGGPMLAFYWSQVGRLLVHHDPVRMTADTMHLLSLQTIRDEQLALLPEALALQPREVWATISEELLRSPEAIFWLQEQAWEVGLLNDVDPKMLLAWAAKERVARPRLLAALAKPGDPLSDLIRGLLRAYGDDGAVAGTLAANFESGVWIGNLSDHEEQQLQQAQRWLTDPEPHVRQWASRIVQSIRQRLPDIKRHEEEAALVL